MSSNIRNCPIIHPILYIMLSQVCAVGWEPNPAHTALLRRLEKRYNECGFRTIIYTETGVDVRNTRNKVDTDTL